MLYTAQSTMFIYMYVSVPYIAQRVTVAETDGPMLRISLVLNIRICWRYEVLEKKPIV